MYRPSHRWHPRLPEQYAYWLAGYPGPQNDPSID